METIELRRLCRSTPRNASNAKESRFCRSRRGELSDKGGLCV